MKNFRKKSIGLLILCSIIMCFVCGCGKTEKPLTVYVVQTEALYKNAIELYIKEYPDKQLDVKYFDSYEEMNERFNTELLSGKGPDVLLFNSFYSTQDPYKLSGSNSLLALDEQVKGLSKDTYFDEILNAGQLNGHQYFVPLSWNIVQAYSTVDMVTEKGYNEDLFSALPVEAAALNEEEDIGASSLGLGRMDMLSYFCEIAGMDIIDMNAGEFTTDQNRFEEISSFVKVIYDNLEKNKNIAIKYRNDFAGAVSHFTYLLEDYPFMNNLRYYETIYPEFLGEEMYYTPFAQWESSEITAQIVQYGAVNANTQNVEGAWELLQYILDAQAETQFSKYEESSIYYAPVNMERYMECVNELASEGGPGPKNGVDPLSDANAQILSDMPERISRVTIPNTSLGSMVQECMEPYLLGEDSFENCYAQFKQKAELYLDE